MNFGPDPESTPSESLKYFTNRVNELTRFGERIAAPAGDPLPMLMFYGVGGAGKTWLLHRMRGAAREANLPVARIDFDRNQGGGAYHGDYARALVSLRGQLDVSCPRFDLAHAMMLHKQGVKDAPTSRHAAGSTAWDLAREVASAALISIPGGNVLAWFGTRAGQHAARALGETLLGRWLASRAGGDDLLTLRAISDQEIQAKLADRLAVDLAEQLPRREGKACRAVLFFDTLEDLRDERLNADRQYGREDWIPRLWARLHEQDAGGCLHPFAQFVVAGRDFLTWAEHDGDLRNPNHLEQHLVGGLSRADAIRFFGGCGITGAKLQDALLASCVDTDTRVGDPGYHAFKLGLFADAVEEERRRGIEPDPATYRLPPGQLGKLVRRFLRSLGDEVYAARVQRLALTPRFDETAGRENFPVADSLASAEAWEHLRRFSFVQDAPEQGWYTLHPQMREGLRHRAARELGEDDEGHEFWRDHWCSRLMTSVSALAGLAWYHYHCLDPQDALRIWVGLAEQARRELRMADHFALLGWWTPTGLESDRDIDVLDALSLVVLADELVQTTRGGRDANLRRAIDCYEAALRVFAENAFPDEWASAQSRLGSAYGSLPTGNRAANLAQAIASHEAALRVYTEAAFPEKRAEAQNNLAIAYTQMPTGNRAKNLRCAVACYEAALRVLTESAFPEQWATIQLNLGTTYSDLPEGDKQENLRRAITCYEAALRIHTQDAFPREWAEIQRSLGTVYRELPTGDRGENVERAIACCEAALRVYTEGDFPDEWAGTQSILGNAYQRLPTGDRGENLERAVSRYEAALRAYTESASPEQWAMTQINLGSAYARLATRDRGKSLERAIACYEAALRVYTEDDFPYKWAGTQNGLGNAHASLRTGNRDQNLERAVAYFEAALRVYTEGATPDEWVATQDYLGDAHSELLTGDRDENLRRAVAYFEAALRVWTKSDFPDEWARTQRKLGDACEWRRAGNREENLGRAIGCYQAALEVYTESAYPADWAKTQYGLGNAYLDRRARNWRESSERAADCYEAALRVWTESAVPFLWAGTQNNLGVALGRLGRFAAARQAFLAAAHGFRTVGLADQAALAEGAVADLAQADPPPDP